MARSPMRPPTSPGDTLCEKTRRMMAARLEIRAPVGDRHSEVFVHSAECKGATCRISLSSLVSLERQLLLHGTEWKST